MVTAWVWLILAIACEVVATNLIPATRSFSVWKPTVVVVVLYGLTFYLLSRVVQVLDVAVMYTLWCALGVLAVAGVGVAYRGERMNRVAASGLSLIVVGVALINLGDGR
jgi:small multidrug resistance pump